MDLLKLIKIVLLVLQELLFERWLKEQVIIIVFWKVSFVKIVFILSCWLFILLPLQIKDSCIFLVLVLKLHIFFTATWKIDIPDSYFAWYLRTVLDIFEKLVIIVKFRAIVVIDRNYLSLLNLLVFHLFLHVQLYWLTIDLIIFERVGVLVIVLYLLVWIELDFDWAFYLFLVCCNIFGNRLLSSFISLFRAAKEIISYRLLNLFNGIIHLLYRR